MSKRLEDIAARVEAATRVSPYVGAFRIAEVDVPYLLAIARAAERVFKKWDDGSDYLDVEIDALRAALESKEGVR